MRCQVLLKPGVVVLAIIFILGARYLPVFAQCHIIDIEVDKDRAWMCLYHSPDGMEQEAYRYVYEGRPTLRELNPNTPLDPSGAFEGTVEGETYSIRDRNKLQRWQARKEYLIRHEDGTFHVIGTGEKVVERISDQVKEYGPAGEKKPEANSKQAKSKD